MKASWLSLTAVGVVFRTAKYTEYSTIWPAKLDIRKQICVYFSSIANSRFLNIDRDK